LDAARVNLNHVCRFEMVQRVGFNLALQSRLPDVLERQELSLNLQPKFVMFLILEKHLVVLENFPASLKILEKI